MHVPVKISYLNRQQLQQPVNSVCVCVCVCVCMCVCVCVHVMWTHYSIGCMHKLYTCSYRLTQPILAIWLLIAVASYIAYRYGWLVVTTHRLKHIHLQ